MSFPRYPTYKDSGIEWVGEIPQHWVLARLKHLVTFIGGGTPSRENPAFWNGTIAWASPKDMKAEEVLVTEESITEAGLRNSASSLIPPGCVLLVVRSGILKHTIPVAINKIVVALNQDMKALHFKAGPHSARFFLRWVQGLNGPLLLAWAKQGATVESVEQAYLADTMIPVPGMAEQCAIATFLDRQTSKIDALVAEQRKVIDLLREKRHAVISHAVTKGLSPDVPMRSSGIEWIGDVPSHWEVVKLGRRIQLQRGADITKDEQTPGNVPVVSSGGILSFHDHALVRGPGVIVGRKGTAGAIYYVDADYWPHDTTLYVKEFGGNVPRYVYYKLESMDIASYDTGSANPTINRNLVHPTEVSWPPLREQVEIAGFLDGEIGRWDALVREAERAIELLQERRTALISAAVTGKIDVRSLVETDADAA